MSKVFTFPGMMGDILMQWPVAYQWYVKHGEPFGIATCEHWGCPRVLDLLMTQPCVDRTVIIEGAITSDHCGGQPWDFGLGDDDGDIFHLGYRSRPDKQLTQFTLEHFPEELDLEATLNEPSLYLGVREPENYCVFFAKPHQNWLTALEIMERVTDRFDSVYVIGLPQDLEHIHGNVPDNVSEKWHYVRRQEPDLVADAKLIRNARVVITINSLVPTISNVLKVPTLVVHRAQPFQVYSNTGPCQFNYFPRHRNDVEEALKFLDHV